MRRARAPHHHQIERDQTGDEKAVAKVGNKKLFVSSRAEQSAR
jgi:hypothetical protein